MITNSVAENLGEIAGQFLCSLWHQLSGTQLADVLLRRLQNECHSMSSRMTERLHLVGIFSTCGLSTTTVSELLVFLP